MTSTVLAYSERKSHEDHAPSEPLERPPLLFVQIQLMCGAARINLLSVNASSDDPNQLNVFWSSAILFVLTTFDASRMSIYSLAPNKLGYHW